MQYSKVFERIFLTKMKRQKSENINRGRPFHYKESHAKIFIQSTFYKIGNIYIYRIVSIALRLSTKKFLHIADED